MTYSPYSFRSLVWCLSGISLLSACAGAAQSLLVLMPGVVNDPANRTLRREIMAFGHKEFCKEAKKHGAPVRLQDESPVIGRFYARNCSFRELPNGDVFVQVQGFGYTWTQATRRMGFEASGAIHYNQDFLLEGSDMYAYFRPKTVQSSDFKANMIEASGSSVVGGFLDPTMKTLADRIGQQLVSHELSRGFTVIRTSKNEVDFGLGIVEKGKRPFHPFQVHGSDKITLGNERVEVHPQQREFLGPFEVDGKNRALTISINLEGVNAVDIMVLPQFVGETWLKAYTTQPALTPLPQPALVSDIVRQNKLWKQTVPLQQGLYYVVIDHSSSAGLSNPEAAQPGILGSSDQVATFNYVVQLGDAP
jgi:hypothetical protein